MTLPKALRLAGYETMFIHDTPHLANFGYGFDRPFPAGNSSAGTRPTAGGPTISQSCRSPAAASSPGTSRLPMNSATTATCGARRTSACPGYVGRLRWLDHNAGHEKFFLWIDSFDPHEPWIRPALRRHVRSRYEGAKITWPSFGEVADKFSAAEQRNVKALYAGEVTLMDRWIGPGAGEDRRLGLREKTAVIIMSDHGFDFFEHGYVGKRASIPRWFAPSRWSVFRMERAPEAGFRSLPSTRTLRRRYST